MNPNVIHNASAERYEIHVGDELAGFTEAHPREDGVVVFPHTEIAKAFEGQGLASMLVRGALDDLRARGVRLKPVCEYVVGWVAKHPEYEDLVAAD